MSEDIGNVEADLEALMAALELAGTMADRARRDALRLARHVRQDLPRSRKEWAHRAQLQDRDGRDLGWLDTSRARRIDLADATGVGDRNLVKQPGAAAADQQGPGQLVEVEGQFFEVSPGAGKGQPERARPISLEDAQARLAEHRPDLSTRVIGTGDPRLDVTRDAQAAESLPQLQRATTAAAYTDRERLAGPTGSTDGPALGPGASRTAAGSMATPTTQKPSAAPASAAAPTPGRSAAEAFGAVSTPGARDTSDPAAADAGAPSTAELTAVGATRQTRADVSR